MDKKNLEIALNSAFPIILIETHEEERALGFLNKVSLKSGKDLMVWTAAKGLHNHVSGPKKALTYEGMPESRIDSSASDQTLEPDDMLDVASSRIKNSVIALLDFHPYLSNPKITRHLKELAQNVFSSGNKIVLVSHDLDVPQEIAKLCTRFELSMPDENEIKKLINIETGVWKIKNKNGELEIDRKAADLLARNLLGLSTSDAKRLIQNAIYHDDAITHSDIPRVMEAKYHLIGQQGVLSFEYETASFGDVGGFTRLKKWLDMRKAFFLDATLDGSIDMPKGILLLGVQGCGKSLAAKAVAGVWGVPLLRLDFGMLYNKYIGETEKNIREALQQAEILSPCVLWVDEIEKGIQSNNEDSGTSQRVLGTLLTWMAERKGRVFIVATSNNIENLPPELVRKGRLDETFFVDLPSDNARRQIFNIHLGKRNIDLEGFDIDMLVRNTKGFSGAEIEQAVVAARFAALSNKQPLSTAHVLQEISDTKPLSVLMSEQISRLRSWAESRTVSVD